MFWNPFCTQTSKEFPSYSQLSVYETSSSNQRLDNASEKQTNMTLLERCFLLCTANFQKKFLSSYHLYEWEDCTFLKKNPERSRLSQWPSYISTITKKSSDNHIHDFLWNPAQPIWARRTEVAFSHTGSPPSYLGQIPYADIFSLRFCSF